jgi:phosphatidylethanolamine N-methyltransferase
MTVPSSTTCSSESIRFHIGQPIRISWNAPPNHSRKDWIGIYRLGSCQSEEITKISSVGKWVPLYDEDWDGDVPIEHPEKGKTDAGMVVFDKEKLPWQPGMYELRLHHDGKHNVMTTIAPLEIFGKLLLIHRSQAMLVSNVHGQDSSNRQKVRSICNHI